MTEASVRPTAWARPTSGPSLTLRTVIHVDDAHPAVPPAGDERGVDFVPLTGEECDLSLILFRLPPNYVGSKHSHGADTVYIVRRGTFSVEGEGTYQVGDIRWVKANTVYGPERAGPEGCEVYLVAAGKFPLPTVRPTDAG